RRPWTRSSRLERFGSILPNGGHLEFSRRGIFERPRELAGSTIRPDAAFRILRSVLGDARVVPRSPWNSSRSRICRKRAGPREATERGPWGPSFLLEMPRPPHPSLSRSAKIRLPRFPNKQGGRRRGRPTWSRRVRFPAGSVFLFYRRPRSFP